MFDFNADSGEIYIYDEIGPSWWGMIDAQSVLTAIKEIGNKHLHVHLNTPGGSVDEGIAIYNALVAHKAGVTTYVDSMAASMGSYLLQAGSKRIVSTNSMVMIHDPWTFTWGNSADLRKEADVLDKYALRMIPDYAAKSGKTEDEVKQVMQDETWYAGQEIVDAGWADELKTVSQDVEPASAGLRAVAKNIPEALKAKLKPMQAGDRTQFPKREAIKHKRGMTVPEARARIAKMDALVGGG